jgi:integrase
VALPTPLVEVMATALTVKSLENLKPGLARREVPDGLLSGLYFIVQPSGKRSWAVRYRASGRPRKLTLGQYPSVDLKSARELARSALAKVAGGADPGAEKKAAKAAAIVPANDMVEAVVGRFVSHYVRRQLKASTAHEVERILGKEVAGSWRGRRLSQIGRADIHNLLDSIVERGSPITANRALSWLRRMCNWAVERGVLGANPCAGIRAPSTETVRDRVLSDAELKAVWEAAGALEPVYAGFIKLLILTGQRLREVSEMEWKEIDLDARLWTLPGKRAKNGVQHEIPMPDLAIEILKACPRIAGSDFVFTVSGRRPIQGHHIVKRRLDKLMPGTPSWTMHDIRRTVASGMARLGVNLPFIEKLLNHVSGSFAGIVGVYQRHSFADEKRAAMQTWARYVEAIVRGEAAANVVSMKAKA